MRTPQPQKHFWNISISQRKLAVCWSYVVLSTSLSLSCLLVCVCVVFFFSFSLSICCFDCESMSTDWARGRLHQHVGNLDSMKILYIDRYTHSQTCSCSQSLSASVAGGRGPGATSKPNAFESDPDQTPPRPRVSHELFEGASAISLLS